MTATEVEFVLNAIRDNWPGPESELSDVPLERIDRDNSLNLDAPDSHSSLSGPLHSHSDALTEMNYVGARSVDVSREFVDTNPDFSVERVVGVRIEGATALGGGFGAIDPFEDTDNERSRGYPTVGWERLKENIVDAIETELKFPDPGRSGTGYKDLLPIDVTDSSAEWGDYYLATFDVIFSGFENGP